MDETLIAFGGAIKAMSDGRVAGRLVRYSDPDSPDLEGEFFTKNTDFGLEFPAKVGVYYNHGMDPQLGKKRLGRAEVKADDEGLWFEAQLDLSDRYQAKIWELAQAGRLGASSGAAPHLVTKTSAGKALQIVAWPLAEASLTVTPAEHRNTVSALKAVSLETLEEAEAEVKAAHEAAEIVSILGSVSGLTLSQHSEAVVSAAEGYCARLESRHAARIKSGRMLSAANLAELQDVQDSLIGLRDRLTTLLEKATAKEADTPQEAETSEEPAAKTPSLRLSTLRQQSRLLQEQFAGVLS